MPFDEPAGGCPVIDAVETTPEEAGTTPPDIPPAVEPPEAPFEAGTLVLATTEMGGAVYTVVTFGGRVAAAPPPPETVVVPVTSLSS